MAQNHCHSCLVYHGAVLRVREKDARLAETIASTYRSQKSEGRKGMSR